MLRVATRGLPMNREPQEPKVEYVDGGPSTRSRGDWLLVSTSLETVACLHLALSCRVGLSNKGNIWLWQACMPGDNLLEVRSVTAGLLWPKEDVQEREHVLRHQSNC